MKKLLVRIILFVALFLVLARIIGIWDNIDKATSTNPNILRIGNAPRFDSLDILFMGSSASYSGINPLYFDSAGLRSFNLGIAAAGPVFYKLLVDDYIRSVIQKPRSVFLLVMPSTFMDHADDFEEIGIHRYLNHPITNETLVRLNRQWATYPGLFIKSFRKGCKNVLYKEKASPAMMKDAMTYKGFYRSDEVTSSGKEKKEYASYAELKAQIFDPAKMQYLCRFADSLQREQIQVVFFTVPGNKTNSFFSEAYMNGYRSALAGVEKRYRFLNLENLPADSTCFRNSDHLNTKGASIVSGEMIRAIRKDTLLRRLYQPNFISFMPSAAARIQN